MKNDSVGVLIKPNKEEKLGHTSPQKLQLYFVMTINMFLH